MLLAPAYGHLLGEVLAAVVVGPWAGCVAMALVLFLQMALFADGGWLAYGANALNMGIVGSLGRPCRFTSLISRQFAGPRGTIAGAVIAAWLSVVAGSALFCVEFALSHRGAEFDVPKLFAVMTTFHSLIGVGEALITGGVVSYLLAVRPDLIDAPHRLQGTAAGLGRVVWTGAVAALAVAAFLARPFASGGGRDGLETDCRRTEICRRSKKNARLRFRNMKCRFRGSTFRAAGPGTAYRSRLAGVFGTSAVLGIAFVFGRIARSKLALREVEATHAR